MKRTTSFLNACNCWSKFCFDSNANTSSAFLSIFEKLGATIKWDQASQTVTGTKGNITIKLTIDKTTAHVNGKAVTLSAAATLVNNSTMVPLRFVSEALGADVKWDQATNTPYIETVKSSGTSALQKSPSGITVMFGVHDYASLSQKEYDASVAVAKEALKEFDSIKFGGINEQYFKEFIGGAMWSGDTNDQSDRNIGLKLAEGSVGPLVKAGVSNEDIQKLYKGMSIAGGLIKGLPVPESWHPNSAYDALAAPVKGSTCYSDSNVYSLIFDLLGYNTAILVGNDHADPIIQANGSW